MEIVAKDILKELTAKRKKLLEFFSLVDCRKVVVNIFERREDFIEKILPYYKSKNEIPEYCIGTIQNGEIYYQIDTSLKREEYRYELQLRHITHEYIHIIYNEYIKQEKRIIWLDEGLAIYLSEEKAYLRDKEKYTNFFNSILSGKINMNMNMLNHEGNFIKQGSYNGYDLSYLCVKYMIEVYSRKELQAIIRDENALSKLGIDILQKAINYYKHIDQGNK